MTIPRDLVMYLIGVTAIFISTTSALCCWGSLPSRVEGRDLCDDILIGDRRIISKIRNLKLSVILREEEEGGYPFSALTCQDA